MSTQPNPPNMKTFLLLLLFGLVGQTFAIFPDTCKYNSDCGKFGKCLESETCVCFMGALPNQDSNGCEHVQCNTYSDCHSNFTNTDCDFYTQQCICETHYRLNYYTQKCEYFQDSSKIVFNLWVWFGPLLGFIVLFPIIIMIIRYCMVRNLLKQTEHIVVTRPVVVAAVVADGHNPNHPNAPPAYGSAYNTNYGANNEN